MHRGLARALSMSGLGAGSGAVAAIIAYAVRQPEHFDLRHPDMTVTVDRITLSDEPWAIVGLSLLGALVCGSVSAFYVRRKGLPAVLRAILVAAPLGALGCWGARWLMDQIIYATLGGPQTVIDAGKAETGTILPWTVWQLGVAFGLTMPIVLAIGANKYTLLRGLIGAVFVMVAGELMGVVATALLVPFLIMALLSGAGDPMSFARIADTVYLFSLGAGAGIAFALAEVVYKPAWLKSFRGPSEGRQWTLSGPLARIGCQEGVEVYLPNDGTVAPVHAQVQAEEDAHFVTDLCGATTVNGAPVQTQWLKDGDQIGVGSALILYRTRLNQPRPEQPRTPQMVPRHCFLLDPLGNRHLLHSGTNVVGREAGCDVALTWEPSVSRRHAEIVVSHAGAALRDCGSTNGTYLDGAKVEGMVPLNAGQEVVFGRCKARFETEP